MLPKLSGFGQRQGVPLVEVSKDLRQGFGDNLYSS
jgi:hypothetical protein